MQPFNQIIQEYLDKKTDSSLLINGKWGSGKTHYVKNELNEIIGEREKKYIYTTANGITSFDEIISQIFSSKFLVAKAINSKYGRLAIGMIKNVADISSKVPFLGNISSIFKFDKVNLEKFVDFSNDVIIVDDLERINFDKLPLNEFLGMINNKFTEHYNIKVILISNEAELLNSIGEEKSKHYNIVKEKFINRSIEYKANIPKALSLFIDELEPGSSRVALNENLDFINEILHLAEIENLRTVKYYIEVLGVILNHVGVNKFKKIPQIILLSTFIIVNEFKKGNSGNKTEEDLIEYLQYSDSIIPFSFSSESEEILVASNKSLKNNNEELIRGVGNYYHFLQSVYIYVYKGILYTDKLTQEIDLFINSLDVETEWNICFNKLTNFRNSENEDFEVNYSNVLKFIEAGKYTPEMLLTFTKFSLFFLKSHVRISFTNSGELINFIENQLDNSPDNFIDWNNHPDIIQDSIAQYPEMQNIFDKAKSKLVTWHDKTLKENAEDSLKKLLNLEDLTTAQFTNMLNFIGQPGLDLIVEKYISSNSFVNYFYKQLKNNYSKSRNELLKGSQNLYYIIAKLETSLNNAKNVTKVLFVEFKEMSKKYTEK